MKPDVHIRIQQDLDKLDNEIHDLNQRQAELNRQYDESLDGSTQKRAAIRNMNAVGELLRAKWSRVDELLREEELGNTP